MMKKLIFLFSFMILVVATLVAQVPQNMSYQAVVRNASHQLVVNSAITVQVRIIPHVMNNAPIYQEEHQTTTNDNGLMTLQIGGGQAIQGVFSAIPWADGPYYLRVDIDPAGGNDFTISSVQQLMSVPYALYAVEAGNGFSGNYEDLANKPNIPSQTSDLLNDAGFVSNTQCDTVNICDLSAQMGQLWSVITAQQNMIDSLTTMVQRVKDSLFPDPVYDTIPIQDVTGIIPCPLPNNDTVILINDQDSLLALCPNAPTMNLNDSSLIMISGYHAMGIQFVTGMLTSSDNQHYQLTVQIMPSPISMPAPWRIYCLIPKISSLSQVVVNKIFLQ